MGKKADIDTNWSSRTKYDQSKAPKWKEKCSKKKKGSQGPNKRPSEIISVPHCVWHSSILVSFPESWQLKTFYRGVHVHLDGLIHIGSWGEIISPNNRGDSTRQSSGWTEPVSVWSHSVFISVGPRPPAPTSICLYILYAVVESFLMVTQRCKCVMCFKPSTSTCLSILTVFIIIIWEFVSEKICQC